MCREQISDWKVAIMDSVIQAPAEVPGCHSACKRVNRIETTLRVGISKFFIQAIRRVRAQGCGVVMSNVPELSMSILGRETCVLIANQNSLDQTPDAKVKGLILPVLSTADKHLEPSGDTLPELEYFDVFETFALLVVIEVLIIAGIRPEIFETVEGLLANFEPSEDF
jgi:hypothetical protein